MMFFEALKKGRSLRDPQFWKGLQNGVTLSGSLIPVMAIIVPELNNWLNPETLAKIYAALGAISMYLTTATSEKIGL